MLNASSLPSTLYTLVLFDRFKPADLKTQFTTGTLTVIDDRFLLRGTVFPRNGRTTDTKARPAVGTDLLIDPERIELLDRPVPQKHTGALNDDDGWSVPVDLLIQNGFYLFKIVSVNKPHMLDTQALEQDLQFTCLVRLPEASKPLPGWSWRPVMAVV